jgi:hypothetical protein
MGVRPDEPLHDPLVAVVSGVQQDRRDEAL